MQTPSRRVLTVGVAVLLIMVVASAGYALAANDQPTELTVENQRNATYQVTAFQTSQNSLDSMEFEFTTTDGTQGYGSLAEVSSSTGYQNTTLLNAERLTRFTVTAGENVTKTLDGWSDRGATAYIVETPEGELLYADGTYCEGGNHTYYLRLRDDSSILSSSHCRQSGVNPVEILSLI